MDPNDNRTPLPSGVPSDEGQPLPVPGSATPDWQRGLGGEAVPQPTPSSPTMPGAVPRPPQLGLPNMPAGQPGNWSTPIGSSVPQTDMSPLSPRRKPTPLLILVIVLAVLAIAAITYLAFFRKDGSADKAAKNSSSNSTAVSATDLSTVDHATLNPPATIAGYKSRDTGSATIKDYIAEDGVCELIVGTVTASQLPGANFDAILSPQLQQLKDAGATVKGPNAGEALALKTGKGSATYRMPTLNFEFSQNAKHASVHYSAVILKSTDRVVVNRTCANKDGAVDANRLKALDDIAKKVTVTVTSMQ